MKIQPRGRVKAASACGQRGSGDALNGHARLGDIPRSEMLPFP